jgi:SAM-dependent methyltransferase
MPAELREREFPPLAVRAQLRWHLVKPIVTALAPRTTIEVGVGQGAMGARIASLTSGSYVAFELDEDSYQKASQRIERAGGVVHATSLEAFDPAPSDLLCAFEVLEHIEEDGRALGEWVGYLVPGGHVLLSVPANPRRFGPMDQHAGHYRRYTAAQLIDLATAAGLVDISAKMYGSPLGYLLEAVRNRIDAKKVANVRDLSTASLTAASGRTFQFDQRSWKSVLATAATLPFRYLQTICPGGVGLVLTARKPLA